MRYDPTTRSYDRTVRFSRGYRGGRKSTDITTGPLTAAYRKGAARMGWDRMTQYCPTCGRLPSWCECPKEERSIGNYAMLIQGDKPDREDPGEQQETHG